MCGPNLVPLGIVAEVTTNCNRFSYFRVNKVSMASFSSAIRKPRLFQIRNDISDFCGHEIEVRLRQFAVSRVDRLRLLTRKPLRRRIQIRILSHLR